MKNNNWKPKVGEACIFNEVGEMPEITPKFVGDDHVVFMRNGVECVNNIKYFSPLKTPAEIEQDRIIDKALSALGHSRGDFTIVSLLKQLYHANLLADKQVKPLSKPYARDCLGIGDKQFSSLLVKGFIVKGGEQ